jgi:hypothetical protein
MENIRARHECNTCGMVVNTTCAKGDGPLVNGIIFVDDSRDV